jgi:hypothetical protein
MGYHREIRSVFDQFSLKYIFKMYINMIYLPEKGKRNETKYNETKWKMKKLNETKRSFVFVFAQLSRYQRVHSICQSKRFFFIKISWCPSTFYLKEKINKKKPITVTWYSGCQVVLYSYNLKLKKTQQ